MRKRSPSDLENRSDPLARAVDLLSRREHTPAELRTKLRAKGFEDPEVSAVLETLTERGLLSTDRYMQARLRQALSQGQGPRRLRQRLRDAGIDGKTIDSQMAAEAGEIDWQAQATEACQRKFGVEPVADARDWNRRARFLLGRGFDESSVRKTLGPSPRPLRQGQRGGASEPD
jgi:regulatory protein